MRSGWDPKDGLGHPTADTTAPDGLTKGFGLKGGWNVSSWLPWVVKGSIVLLVLFVVGVLALMVVATIARKRAYGQ